jgi:FkbM family methyltransferase
MKYLCALQGLGLIKNKTEVIKHLFGINKKKTITYNLRDGFKLFVPNSKKNRTTILSINEIFNQEIYPIKKSQEERIILDIGAQSEIFSIYALSKNKSAKIFSFEPDPENYIQLKENIEKNKIEKNITPINKALSKGNGKISFYIHPESSRANSIYEKNGEKTEVDSISLKQLFTELKIKKCDIMKMDIEGAEYETLYNSPKEVLNKIKIIFIECHEHSKINKKYNKEGMINFLSENGFKIIKDKEGILIALNEKKK